MSRDLDRSFGEANDGRASWHRCARPRRQSAVLFARARVWLRGGPARRATGTPRRDAHEEQARKWPCYPRARRDRLAVSARTPAGKGGSRCLPVRRAPLPRADELAAARVGRAGALFTRPGKALRRGPSACGRPQAPTSGGSAPPRPTFAATPLEPSAKRVTREQEFPRASLFNLPPENALVEPKTCWIVTIFSTGYEPSPCRHFGVSAT